MNKVKLRSKVLIVQICRVSQEASSVKKESEKPTGIQNKADKYPQPFTVLERMSAESFRAESVQYYELQGLHLQQLGLLRILESLYASEANASDVEPMDTNLSHTVWRVSNHPQTTNSEPLRLEAIFLHSVIYPMLSQNFQMLSMSIDSLRRVYPASVKQSSQLPLILWYFKVHDYRRFRRNLKVHPTIFNYLLYMMNDDHTFGHSTQNAPHSVNSGILLLANIQLATALYRFGHYGDAATCEDIAQWAGISAGSESVVNCTRRVMSAFLLFHEGVIKWPNEEKKKAAKDSVEALSCPAWRNGYCMVDGTLIPLYEKPTHFG